MIENLYGSLGRDAISGDMKCGTVISTFAMIHKGVTSKTPMHYLKMMLLKSEQAQVGDLDPYTNKPFTEESLAFYRSNTKQFIMHISTVTGMTILGALTGGDEEDELSDTEKFLKYTRLRFTSELMSFLWIGDTYRVMKHPTAAITYLDNIGKLMEHAVNWDEASDVLESGKYKGDTKFEANVKRLLPFEKQVSKLDDIDSLIDFYSN